RGRARGRAACVSRTDELIDQRRERSAGDGGGFWKEARGGEAGEGVDLEEGHRTLIALVADDEVDAGEVAATERLVCRQRDGLDAAGELFADRCRAGVEAAARGVAGFERVEGVVPGGPLGGRERRRPAK